MTFVVTENCINCKHTTCIEVCPVDAFREGPNFLVIDPSVDGCIDCNLYPSECPEDAIFAEDEVPEEQIHFIALNAELAKVWPDITTAQAPLVEAEQWSGVANKLEHLIR